MAVRSIATEVAYTFTILSAYFITIETAIPLSAWLRIMRVVINEYPWKKPLNEKIVAFKYTKK